MRYVKGLYNYENPGRSAVTFGKFDGLHRGHMKLVGVVKELAQREDIESVVCAFDMGTPENLMTRAERADRLRRHGADCLTDCAFTKEFREMPAEDFIKDVIRDVFHAAYVVVGTDFRFGCGARGDIHMLKAYEREYGYELRVIDKERYGDRIISSSYIKEVLRKGDVPLAGTLLGYPYGVSGVVEHGKQLGRTLGFPTFNVLWPEEKLIPPRGVYLCRVLADGQLYPGIANIGVKPTVSEENKVRVESFLFGYDGNAYGKDVEIRLLEYVRPEQRFADKGELKACVDRDIARGKTYFGIED